MRRAAALLVAVLAAAPVSTQSADELFVHRGAANMIRADGAVVSRAEVGLRLTALFAGAAGATPRIVLNLGPQRWTAVFERLDRDAAGFRSWVGRIESIADSHVVITERAGVVSGLIDGLSVTYQLRTVAGDVHVLEQIETSRLRDEPDPILPDSYSSPGPSGQAVTADDGSAIDVLLLYTPAARGARGGTAQIEALASQIISDTNTAFARSGVPARVRLLAAREFARVEAPQLSGDLIALRSSPEARALRDAARADLVQLLVSSSDQSACGVGYLLSSLADTNFDAYSVADVACVAQYTPTHEMGHNLGSQHAPEDGSYGALFPYSYGFKDPAGEFRTVMAYRCASGSCPRVPNFSSPRVTQNGVSTGSAIQDNARSITEAAFTAANFRQAATPTLTPPATPTNLRAQVIDGAVTVMWDPVSADAAAQRSAASAYVLQAGTAPGLWNLFNGSVGNTTTASGVLLPGAYFWRVIAVNAAGQSAPSSEAQFVVSGCTAPAAPVNFTFVVSNATVTLVWAPSPGTPAATYMVEAGTGPALADLLVAPVGSQTTVVTSAPAGRYYVRIRAQNACGTSPPSNEHVIVVP